MCVVKNTLVSLWPFNIWLLVVIKQERPYYCPHSAGSLLAVAPNYKAYFMSTSHWMVLSDLTLVTLCPVFPEHVVLPSIFNCTRVWCLFLCLFKVIHYVCWPHVCTFCVVFCFVWFPRTAEHLGLFHLSEQFYHCINSSEDICLFITDSLFFVG